MISLGLEGCGGTAHTTVLLQWTDTSSSEKIGWEGEDAGLKSMQRSCSHAQSFPLEHVIK